MHLAQVSITSPSTIFTSYSTLPAVFVGRFLIYAILLAGIYFFVRLLTAGFQLMSSMGDPAKISTAQNVITNSLFGLLIVICAFLVVQLIQSITGINLT
jgi:hypothetical protein